MEKILAGKRTARKQLANLPFAEKLALVEKMRDRSRFLAASPLRRQPQKQISPRHPSLG